MIIGLTGGIGSGKTTVGKIFTHLGIPVYLADEAAKKLIDRDPHLQRELQNLVGKDLVADGKINRPYMARRVFADEQLLQEVNAVVHPAVARDFQEWYKKQDSPYVLREAAILYESGSYRDCHKVIVVTAPESLRITRVQNRSGESREQIKQRMQRQWPQEEKNKRGDYLIYNDEKHAVIPQVLAIHEDIIRSTNAPS